MERISAIGESGEWQCWHCGKQVDTFTVGTETRQYSIDTIKDEISESDALIQLLALAIKNGYTGQYLILDRAVRLDLFKCVWMVRDSILINKQVSKAL